MKLFGLPVYAHHAIPEDEAWIVRDANAEELPAEVKGDVRVPCVLTGDVARLKQAVTTLRINELLASVRRDAPTPRRPRHSKRAHHA